MTGINKKQISILAVITAIAIAMTVSPIGLNYNTNIAFAGGSDHDDDNDDDDEVWENAISIGVWTYNEENKVTDTKNTIPIHSILYLDLVISV